MDYYQMTGFMGVTTDDGVICEGSDLPDPAKAALLLDFDGTLIDIADTPDGIDVPEAVTRLLDRAMERLDGRVAIISGRPVADLERYLPNFDGAIIGTHGAEMRYRGKLHELVQVDHATVARLIRIVDDFAALRPEFLVEHKPSGVVLHYRQAERQSALALRFMESLAMAADGFSLQPALMAYELKAEATGKDSAMERLLSEDGFKDAVPVFAGDDLTDEPALELAMSRGGVGIKIGQAESVATHRLPDPAGLRGCLEAWLG